MAVSTLRASSAPGIPTGPEEAGQVAENLRILHTREAKLSPLFATLNLSLMEAQTQADRVAFELIIAILEVTPIETIVVGERIVRFKNRKRDRPVSHKSCVEAI